MRKTTQRECKVCGNPIPTESLGKFVHCSMECYERSKFLRAQAESELKGIPLEKRPCKRCGKLSWSRYCSLSCQFNTAAKKAKEQSGQRLNVSQGSSISDELMVKILEEELARVKSRLGDTPRPPHGSEQVKGAISPTNSQGPVPSPDGTRSGVMPIVAPLAQSGQVQQP
jgi:hypothetical protein